MEDLEALANETKESAPPPPAPVEAEEEERPEEQYEVESGVSFDDIVSFTMLLETAVMLIAIAIFTVFFVF